MSDSSNEFQDLLAGLIDDSLSPEQSRRLAELVQSDADARALYLEHCRIHAALAWEHGVLGGMQSPVIANDDSLEAGKVIDLRQLRHSRNRRRLSIAAAVTLLAALSWQVLLPGLRRSAWDSSEIVGTVSRKAGGELRVLEAGLQLAAGDPLHAGDYLLSGGLTQLAFDNNVKVLIEAPARFQIASSKLLILHEGQLSATVPPEGLGFTVETPDAEVVDFGTEFGVEVSAKNGSEIHVFEGEVEVKSRVAPLDPVRLLADQATRVETGATDPSGLRVAPERFLRSFDEPALPYSRAIRKLEPVAYYRMRISDDGSTLLDRSGNEYHGMIDRGLLERPSFAPGRIGAALRLEGSSRKAYAMAEDYPKATGNQLSVVAWVWADSRPRWASIALNWSTNQTGQFRFCLLKDQGGLKAQVRQADGNIANAKDPEPFPLGEWQHVAFVADGENLNLYRNGVMVDQVPHAQLVAPVQEPLGIGARIVDADTPTGRKGVEIWDGQIDELAIFNHAITAEQIWNLYNATAE